MKNMKPVIESFDNYLNSKRLKFEAIIIGGAALNIMDVTSVGNRGRWQPYVAKKS
jgi:hypothetical protein